MSETKAIKVRISRKEYATMYLFVPANCTRPEQLIYGEFPSTVKMEFEECFENEDNDYEIESVSNVSCDDGYYYDALTIGDFSAIKQDLPPQREKSEDEMI